MPGEKSLVALVLIIIMIASLSELQLLCARSRETPKPQGQRIIRILGTLVEINEQGLVVRGKNRTVTALCKGSWAVQINGTREVMSWENLSKLMETGNKVSIAGVPIKGKLRALIIVDKDKGLKAVNVWLLRRTKTKHIKPTGVNVRVEGSIGKKVRVGFVLVQDTRRALVFCIGKWRKSTGDVITHIDLLKELEVKDQVEVKGRIIIIHQRGRVHIAINAQEIVDLTKGIAFTRAKS